MLISTKKNLSYGKYLLTQEHLQHGDGSIVLRWWVSFEKFIKTKQKIQGVKNKIYKETNKNLTNKHTKIFIVHSVEWFIVQIKLDPVFFPYLLFISLLIW